MWYIVRDVLDNIFDQLVLSTHKSNQVNENRINEIKNTMFAPLIDYKCVTTMRLEDEAHHYTYIKLITLCIKKIIKLIAFY